LSKKKIVKPPAGDLPTSTGEKTRQKGEKRGLPRGERFKRSTFLVLEDRGVMGG